MVAGGLKSKATISILWNTFEKFSVKGGQFVIGIILARLLLPEDFGLIGMLSIFLAISQAFITSGMGSGLIQKKNRTNDDFSTVFVFNVVVSVLFYAVLYVLAPLIADFFETPRLVLLTRVLTLNIVVNSLSNVQRTWLVINLDFKTTAIINVVSVIVSGCLGIYFAYIGYGVWALVLRNLFGSIISVFIFWFIVKWKPSIRFSIQSFKELFGFGSKILLASIIGQVFNNVYNVFVGKAFSANILGYYTTAEKYSDLLAQSISSVTQQVTYPILASLQDDKERMVSVYKRLIHMTVFFIFPVMTLLSLLADPFVRIFLTDKWASVVPLLKWMAFAKVFYPIKVINTNILNANGRSDLFLKVDLVQIPLLVLMLLVTIPLGLKAIVIGHVIISFLSFIINAYVSGKLCGYGVYNQLKDLLFYAVATTVMAIVVYYSISFIQSNYLKLIIGCFSGLVSYMTVCYFLKVKELKEVSDFMNVLKNRIT
jgi:O-antigen/teichoic acid export membrane protein